MSRVQKLLVLTLPTFVLLLVAGEIVFRFIIPAADWPPVVFDREAGILKYDVTARRTGVYSTGPLAEATSRWRINNDGWNSAIDYTPVHGPVPRIAIVGDSYIDALMVDVDKTMAADLRRAFGNRAEIYTLGMSGAPLSEYLHLARYAAAHFQPDVFVINVVHNDFDESIRSLAFRPQFLQFEADGGGVREVPPLGYSPSRGRRMLRHSAIFRWLMQNLQLTGLPARLAAKRSRKTMVATTDIGNILSHRAVIEAAVRAIAAKLRAENPNARIVFVIDAARQDIYAGSLANSPVRVLSDITRGAAAAANCEFLDLTPAFAADWSKSHRVFNFRSDWHWNEDGHRVAAKAVYEFLAGGERGVAIGRTAAGAGTGRWSLVAGR